MAPQLDDAEAYFGKPGEVIVCNLSGSRTIPRTGNPNQNRQTQEIPRTPEMRYSSSSSPQQTPGYGYATNGRDYEYQQASPTSFREPQQYNGNQGGYRQAAAAPSYTQPRQYPAKSQGQYESDAASRYY